MASTVDFVEFVCDQLRGAGDISCRKLFGEYGLYDGKKFFACICDNQFFVKITKAGQELMPSCPTAPPYPGASLYFLITELEDAQLLHALVQATCAALPEPRPKKKKLKHRA